MGQPRLYRRQRHGRDRQASVGKPIYTRVEAQLLRPFIMVRITTARLRLRSWREADIDRYDELNPSVAARSQDVPTFLACTRHKLSIDCEVSQDLRSVEVHIAVNRVDASERPSWIGLFRLYL